VLTETARRTLAASARGPIACIAPGHTLEPPPAPAEVGAACARHGIAPEGFALYAGNLDRYQDLAVLDAAVAREPGLSLVAVTHDARAARFRHLRAIEVGTIEEARLLTYGAAVAVLPRRHAGGFPLKLLHYMEAGRTIVARAGMAGALVHDESAWLLRDSAGPEHFAAAIRRLAEDRPLRDRLGAGARRALATHHAWPARAAETLALVRTALGARSRR
jgi:glycosyltransferase involved in cell wall biosynthesis